MRSRDTLVAFSAALLSAGLLSLVPASLHWVSTWKELNITFPAISVQNYFMPLGFYSLGFELVGLIVLWTGYVRRQRAAWFSMLVITLFFVFPLNGLKLLLEMNASILSFHDLTHGVRAGSWHIIWTVLGAVTFMLMLVSLFLPFHLFFFKKDKLPLPPKR